MKITYSTISKTGKRSNNENAFKVIYAPEKGCWMGIVCDGMGGHAMGEVASETVVKSISDYWKEHSNIPDSTEKVAEACTLASAAIDRRADVFNHCTMGTTMVMASIQGSRITDAQFDVQPGDRIFICSDGLYKCIAPNILKARLMDDKTPEDILDVFDFLCERSGDDNYTAIMGIID